MTHQPGVYVPLRALFLVLINMGSVVQDVVRLYSNMSNNYYCIFRKECLIFFFFVFKT